MPTDLTITEITKYWKDELSRIHHEGVEALINWLRRRTHTTDAVNFFAKRDRRQQFRADISSCISPISRDPRFPLPLPRQLLEPRQHPPPADHAQETHRGRE